MTEEKTNKEMEENLTDEIPAEVETPEEDPGNFKCML